MHLFDLPLEILEFLRAYLCQAARPEQFSRPELHKPSVLSERAREENEWRNFLNSSKLLTELKRKASMLVITHEFALRFLKNAAFRARVISVVANQSKQLHFRFEATTEFDNLDYFGFDYSQGIRITNTDSRVDFSAFAHVSLLDLSDDRITFIRNLENLICLRLECCYALRTIGDLPSLQRLYVDDCPELTMISNLPALQQLYLDNCHSLETVSVPSLDILEIHDCHSFEVPSELIISTKVHVTLDFDVYGEAKEELLLPHLKHLESVKLYKLALEPDQICNLLPTVCKLSLQYCFEPVISNLPQLHSLLLEDCEDPIIQFASLPALRILEIHECEGLEKLEISGSLNDSQSLPMLTRVELHNCNDLMEIVVNRKIRLLSIRSKKKPEVTISKATEPQCLHVNELQFGTRNGTIKLRL